MAQHDYVIANGTGAAVRSDLNNALAAIVSQNSGATEPATTYAFQFWADTTTGLLKLRNSSNNAWVTLFQLDGEWSTLPVENGTAAAPSIYFKDSGTDTGFYSPGTDQIGISTAGTSRLTIDANGNLAVDTNTLYVDAPNNRVGIGTSSPGDKLHVAGNALFGTGASAVTIGGTTAAPSGPTDKNLTLSAWSATSGTNEYGGDLTLAAGRPVGGGSGVTGSVYIKVGKSGVGSTGLGTVVDAITASIGTLTFKTDDTERLRIDSSGRVGIGTSPADQGGSNNHLQVHSSSTSSYLTLTNSTTGTNAALVGFNVVQVGVDTYLLNRSNGQMLLLTNGTEAARIDTSQRFLVGTSTASGFASARMIINSAGTDTTGSANLVLQVGEGNSTISANEQIGNIIFGDESGYSYATISALADLAAGSDSPGRLVFSTTADGASSPTERMRITNAGGVKLGGVDSNLGSSIHEATDTGTSNATFAITKRNTSFSGGSPGGNGVFEMGCTTSASIYWSLAEWFSGNGSSNLWADKEYKFRGDGNAYCDGSWSGGGADYAEYFEWSDANPDAEDRRGISVVLDGNKIREAVVGEDPIGVISGNPSVVGDAAWNKWSGKYLRDEFGTYIYEDYEVEDEGGNTVVQQRRKLNPVYDHDVEYIPREQRPEWDCVGLMGKLRIRKGQITGPRWIKMRDISDSVEEWLVR